MSRGTQGGELEDSGVGRIGGIGVGAAGLVTGVGVGAGGDIGHSHAIRLTGPRLHLLIFFVAHFFSRCAVSWHFAIPEASMLEGGGCLSMIMRALCRWTVTLIEASKGSTRVRLISWGFGFERLAQDFMALISQMVLHRSSAAGPKAPVLSN